jgi:Dolichyl-phosphate-mannose-protein mannosyltransferase
VRRLIRKHSLFFVATILAALALRLIFFVYFPVITDDSRIYAELATNWLQHGVYGQSQAAQQVPQVVPTDTRLPGYPAFLAGIFLLFGPGNFRAVMLAQILLDLATCLIVADLARRMVSERAAQIAFVLAALCPFLANYAAAVLTETLEVFFTALALDGATAALGRMREGEMGARGLWAAVGLAIAACILLRPDGGILLASVILYLLYLAVAAPKGASDFGARAASLNSLHENFSRFSGTRVSLPLFPALKRRAIGRRPSGARNVLIAGMIVAVFALAPLAPWTIRNFRTLHHFQPLAPRYANAADELAPRGFNRWVKTWIIDYASVEEIYWNVPGDKIDVEKLPSRAIESAVERETALALIADYNQSQDLTPALDARFGQIAADRIRAHRMRYYVLLPLLRVAEMWLRPRTEILPPDVRWWEFNDDAKHSVMAVGFGLLNLAYVGAALLAVVFRTSPRASRGPLTIHWVGLLVSFVLLRSAFLGTLGNPEPRYTLECYPAVIVLAAAFVARATLNSLWKKCGFPWATTTGAKAHDDFRGLTRL